MELHENTPQFNKDFIMNNRLVFWDTETTGLNFRGEDRIIQFAAIEVINGIKTREISFLINPEGKSVADSFEVHGISDEMLYNQPIFKERIPEIVDFLKDALTIGHNQSFDRNFLNMEFKRAGVDLKFEQIRKEEIDSYFISKSFYSDKGFHSQDKFMEYVGIDASRRAERHDALIDADLLREAFLKSITELGFDLSLLKLFKKIQKIDFPQLDFSNTTITPVMVSNSELNNKKTKSLSL